MSNPEAVHRNTPRGHQAADHPIWRKLIGFKFDDPGTRLTFARRLARENGWATGFAERIVEEYRRFLFLSQTAGHPVTPSDDVDQAWHLHLVYTRSYWEDLCDHVLGNPLHHGPTRGGRREDGKFADWYERTLASYRTWFGEEPPADIWPASAQRFGKAASFRRVSTQDFWLLPKRLLRRVALNTAVAIGALGTMGFIAAVSTGGLIILGVAVLLLIVIPLCFALAAGSGRRRNGNDGTGCGGTGGGCGSAGKSGGDAGDAGSSGCGGTGCGGGGCGGGGCGGGS